MSDQQVNSASAANRYGAAIFELASEGKNLARVKKELMALQSLLAKSSELSAVLASPLIKAAQKNAVLQDITKHAKFTPLIGNFIGVICANGRAAELSDIVTALVVRIELAAGTLRANAKTAQALSAKQKVNLETGLKKTLGRTVKLNTEVDRRLLGGLVVQIGSVMFDSSLKTQLEGLKLAMKES